MFQTDFKNDLQYYRKIDLEFQIQLKFYFIKKSCRCLTEHPTNGKGNSISSP